MFFMIYSQKSFRQSFTHPPPLLVLSIPLMGGNSCGVTPESRDTGRWEKPMWDSHPPFLPSQSPQTHNLSFQGCGHFALLECAVFVTHTVCLISHIDEIPETKIFLAPIPAYSCCVTVSPQGLSATVLERVSRYEWPTADLQPYKSFLKI